jgi:hypothetical protein
MKSRVLRSRFGASRFAIERDVPKVPLQVLQQEEVSSVILLEYPPFGGLRPPLAGKSAGSEYADM